MLTVKMWGHPLKRNLGYVSRGQEGSADQTKGIRPQGVLGGVRGTLGQQDPRAGSQVTLGKLSLAAHTQLSAENLT